MYPIMLSLWSVMNFFVVINMWAFSGIFFFPLFFELQLCLPKNIDKKQRDTKESVISQLFIVLICFVVCNFEPQVLVTSVL